MRGRSPEGGVCLVGCCGWQWCLRRCDHTLLGGYGQMEIRLASAGGEVTMAMCNSVVVMGRWMVDLSVELAFPRGTYLLPFR